MEVEFSCSERQRKEQNIYIRELLVLVETAKI